jgi:hypothetical protein
MIFQKFRVVLGLGAGSARIVDFSQEPVGVQEFPVEGFAYNEVVDAEKCVSSLRSVLQKISDGQSDLVVVLEKELYFTKKIEPSLDERADNTLISQHIAGFLNSLPISEVDRRRH